MPIIRRIFYALVFFAIAVVIIGTILPAKVHVERSMVFKATPAQVYAQVNGMRAFHAWSPWTSLDTKTNYIFSGPDTGVGSRMAWASANPNVGTGSQVITKAETNKHVSTELQFGEKGGGVATFNISKVDGGTRLVWGFDTDFGWDLTGRYVGLMMDGLIGPQYEKGLATLKQRLEAGN